MQPTALNALVALVAASPAPVANGGASGTTDDAMAGNNPFSQLLSDSGKQFDGQQAFQQQAQGKILQATALGALTAQEVSTPSDQLAALLQSREQVITPEDASELLKRLDLMMQQNNGGKGTLDDKVLAQIKEQLQRIERTGEPQTIAQILQASPAVKEGRVSIVGLTLMLSAKKESIQQPSNATSDDDEEATPGALVQTVPSTLFRPDGGTVEEAQAAATEQKTQDTGSEPVATTTIIVPLAAVITHAQAAPVETGTIETSEANALPGIRSQAELDAAIPPLKLEQANDALPSVELPKLTSAAAEQKAAQTAESFQAMATAAGASPKDVSLTAEAPVQTIGDKSVAALTALNTPSHAHGFSPTQTQQALQPVVNVVPTHGYINQAPVVEQVHVAVKQAAKDGIDHITIQLDPVGMGRVEVSMRTGQDGLTQIIFTVDKPDTFDTLSRDARTLERSLQESGLKADTGSMQFNMRQQPQLQSDMGQGQRSQQHAELNEAADEADSNVASIASADITRNYLINVREGVDISA